MLKRRTNIWRELFRKIMNENGIFGELLLIVWRRIFTRKTFYCVLFFVDSHNENIHVKRLFKSFFRREHYILYFIWIYGIFPLKFQSDKTEGEIINSAQRNVQYKRREIAKTQCLLIMK